MTEFDEIMYMQSIADLHKERGEERTPDEVRRGVRAVAKKHGLGIEQAYEAIESQLLANNPNPESWDTDE